VQIAVDAGQRKILSTRITAMLARNYVLDMQLRERNIVLAETAILATMRGSPPYQVAKRRIH